MTWRVSFHALLVKDKNLSRFLCDQREQLASDCPAYEEIPDRPSQTSNSFYFGDLADVDICSELSADRQQQLRNLCADYQDIFIRPSKILIQTNVVYHCINTSNVRPVRRPPRRLTPQEHYLERLVIENWKILLKARQSIAHGHVNRYLGLNLTTPVDIVTICAPHQSHGKGLLPSPRPL